MHAGGSMTGGSANQKSQNLLGRDRMIRELRLELEDKAKALERAMETIGALQKQQEDTLAGIEAARYAQQQAGDRRRARYRAAGVRQSGAGCPSVAAVGGEGRRRPVDGGYRRIAGRFEPNRRTDGGRRA